MEDEADDYIERQRRASRIRAIIAVLVLIAAAVGVLFMMGQSKRQSDALTQRLEQLTLLADADSLKEVLHDAGQVVSEDSRASAALLAADSRAELLLYTLYTGRPAQLSRARELLGMARQRDASNPGVLAAQVFTEAVDGSPARALELLEQNPLPGLLVDWGAVARSEALLREGQIDEARAALQGGKSPLVLAWTARLAWATGDTQGALQAAQQLATASPEHEYGRVLGALATSRGERSDAAEARLRPMVEGGALQARLAELVTSELSRVLRRSGRSEAADELLRLFLEQDQTASELWREQARAQRFAGQFGAARASADKGLRVRGDDPQLLAEFAAAAYFNDAAEMIQSRLKAVPEGSEESDGVKRARAIEALVRGATRQAVTGLEATRHLGLPGDTDLFLAEAWIRAGEPEKAIAAARSAADKLASAVGPDSREVAVAQMYEGLAVGLAGNPKEAQRLLDQAYRPEVRSPWGAWLLGRFHSGAAKPDDGVAGYLLACHNGQDFALACFDLAEIYKALPVTKIRRSTQREAWSHYLRTSPDGWHSGEVKNSLSRR